VTRKFLVPIVLPADPAAAMEAVTKQYVDGVVVVATTDPIGANPNAELWYDSDAPDILALPSSVPRGIVAKGTMLTSLATIPITVTTTVTDPLSVLMQNGRLYRVVFKLNAIRPPAQMQCAVALLNSAASVSGGWYSAGTGWGGVQVMWLVPGDGTTMSLTVTMAPNQGPCDMSWSFATGGSAFYVEDVGLAI
jgi:hypothetical protein